MGKITKTIYIETELIQKVEEEAKRENRSRNYILEKIIKKYFKIK